MALKITGRRENKTGGNTHYKIGGKIVSRAAAVKMCRRKKLPGYQVMLVNGVYYLRNKPDGIKKNNIDFQRKI